MMDRNAVRQVPLPESSDRFRPVAVVTLEPGDFFRWGVEFQEGNDNLDFGSWAMIRVGTIDVLLQRYRHSPSPGTEVLTRQSTDPDDSIAALLSALGLDSGYLSWVAPDVAHHTARAY